MDEKDKRRAAHVKQLERNHSAEFRERFGSEVPRAKLRQRQVAEAVSADWNRKHKQSGAAVSGGPEFGKALPENWRDAHWKTLQAMAADYAGVQTANKEESLEALEAYEAGIAGRPAA